MLWYYHSFSFSSFYCLDPYFYFNNFYSETSLIGPPLGPTMSGPINETIINAAIKESGPINKVKACYTVVLQNAENLRHSDVFMTNPQQHTVVTLLYTDS